MKAMFVTAARAALVAAAVAVTACGAETVASDNGEGTAEAVAAAVTEEAAPDNSPRLTGPQRNAQRSARNYLSMKGFSREGLIEQLSSEYGEGYELADATVAVDSLDIDYNENAAKSGRDYLAMSGFSCRGLIEQLSSSYGDGYTEAQATYGAQQAGAC